MLHLYGLFIIDQRNPLVKTDIRHKHEMLFFERHQILLDLAAIDTRQFLDLRVRSDPLSRMTEINLIVQPNLSFAEIGKGFDTE